MSQAQRSTQAGKRRGSALESRGSKRARVLRHEPAANLPAGVAEEELMEEELTPPPEDTSGSESESDSGSGSDSSGEKTESEQTRRRDGGGEGQSGRRQEQPAESFEEEAEFVRVSTSETQSPEVQESAEGSRRTEEPRTAALSPRTVRRQRSAKHAHAAALRKAPATKNNQKGAMRAFQKFWRSDPYNMEGQQEVNEENVRTFFHEIDEERTPTVDKYVKGLQLTMRQIWASGGKRGPEPNIRRYDEVKHRRAAAKHATAALRRRPGYDKQRDKPDRISRQDITRVIDLMTKYLCLTKQELAEHKMTRGTLINMRADVLEWFTTMTRSKTTREGELSDLSIHREDDIGPSPGYTLDIINDTGKTNENGNMDVTSVLQNKDAAMCAWGPGTHALFYNWAVAKKKRPKASETDWYTWKKSPGRKGEEAGYSYSTQRKYIQHFMKELGIDSRKATHVGRRHGARDAAIWASRGDVKKYARFTTNRSDHFSRSYAQDSPMTLQFGMAGFQKEAVERNFTDGYRLARLVPEVPEGLLKKFCPWVEKEYRKIKQRNATATLDGDKRVTSENFFQFLACGKEVFLSSLAAIEPVYPDLCLFKDMSVFEAPEWAAYKRAVQEADANPDRCLPPKQDNQSLLMRELRKHSDQLGELFLMVRSLASTRESASVSGAPDAPSFPHGPTPPTPPDHRARGSATEDRQPGEPGRGAPSSSTPLPRADPSPRAVPRPPADNRWAPPDFRPELSGARFEHRRNPQFESAGWYQPGTGRRFDTSYEPAGERATGGRSGRDAGFEHRHNPQRASAGWYQPGTGRSFDAPHEPARERATGGRSGRETGGGAGREGTGLRDRREAASRAHGDETMGGGAGMREAHPGRGTENANGAQGAEEVGRRARGGAPAESDDGSEEVYEEGEAVPGQAYVYPWPACSTVADVYREMHSGFAGHMPALVELERAHGSAWRRGKGHRQRFNEKVQICKYVEHVQREHGFENAVTAVDFLSGRYRSLKSLLKDLRALKKAGQAAAAAPAP